MQKRIRTSDLEWLLKELLLGNQPHLGSMVRQSTDDYQTLAGLVRSKLDRLPIIGDKLKWQECSMTVVEVEECRVTRVLLRKE